MRVITSVLVLVTLVPSLNAQTIKGVILNSATKLPVADASVVLIDKNGAIKRGYLTDQDGAYTLMCPEPGTYTLRVGGAGFPTWDSQPMKVKGNETVEFTVRLVPDGSSVIEGFLDRWTDHVTELSGSGKGRFAGVYEWQVVGVGTKGVLLVHAPNTRSTRDTVVADNGDVVECRDVFKNGRLLCGAYSFKSMGDRLDGRFRACDASKVVLITRNVRDATSGVVHQETTEKNMPRCTDVEILLKKISIRK